MQSILKKSIQYDTIDGTRTTLNVGTRVTVDLSDGTACFQGDWFDISPDEVELQFALLASIGRPL